MITEADARVLEPGTTIVLVTGGHITPLAQDTLAERRISVISDRQLDDAASLAPRADIRTVALAGDHTSLALKRAIVMYLRGRGIAAPRSAHCGIVYSRCKTNPVHWPSFGTTGGRHCRIARASVKTQTN